MSCHTIWYNLDIDDCKETPCDNGGKCIDGIASYKCVCPIGFQGIDCETSNAFGHLLILI